MVCSSRVSAGRRPATRRAGSRGAWRRARQLHRWLPTLSWTRPDQPVDLFNQVTRLGGWRFVGAGLGLASGAGVLCGASLVYMAALGPALSASSFPFTLISAPVPLVAIPAALGAALGFRHAATRAATTQPATESTAPAAWEGRRASDYLAPWVNWALTALMVALAAVCAALALAMPAIAGPDTTPGAIAAARLTQGAGAITLLACPLVWRLVIHWVATAPRAISFPYSGIASDAEDFARGQFIAHILPVTLFAGAWMALVQTDALDSAVFGGGAGSYAPFIPLVIFALVMGAACAIGFYRGRLGGSRTGWPWSPRRPGIAGIPAASSASPAQS